MLENVINDKDFADLMRKNLQDLVVHFFQKEQNFGVLCKIEEVSFEPALPENINSEFRPLTLFFLAGYTFETAKVFGDCLVFEAGFGAENYGSVVTVPLLSIMQIIIDETPVMINLASYQKVQQVKQHEAQQDGIENSMASFLSNPENSKFFKK